MRNDLTANFLAVMSEHSRTPIQFMVVHSSFGDLYIADRDITIDGQVFEGIVEDWGTLSTVGDENAISGTMRTTVAIWNGGSIPFSQRISDSDPANTFVEIYQTFDGLSFTDAAILGHFVMQDPITFDEVSSLIYVEFVTTNMRYFGQVGTLLTRENFPNALDDHLNQPIDLIVGDAGTVQCLCSVKPPHTTLRGSILKLPTTITVTDDLNALNFLSSGFLQIDDEILQYDSRTSDTFNVVTRGYNSTITTEHSDGVEIVQAHQDIEYLVGQGPVTSINNVKVEGFDTTIPYTVFPDENPARIVFEMQPTFASYSRGARSLLEYFDAPADDNTAFRPDLAYNPDEMAKGAIMSASWDRLAVLQHTSPQDEGEIVKLFLTVSHWATKAYLSDRVDVYVDGIGVIGFLNRPNEADLVEMGGEIDIDHSHDHVTGGEHGHMFDDPNYVANTSPHLHGVSITTSSNFTGNPSYIYDTNATWLDKTFASAAFYTGFNFPGKSADVVISFTITNNSDDCTNCLERVNVITSLKAGFKIRPGTYYAELDVNVYIRPGGSTALSITLPGWTTAYGTVSGQLWLEPFYDNLFEEQIPVMSNIVAVCHTAVDYTADATAAVGVTNTTSGDVNNQGIDTTATPIKDVNDVADLTEAQNRQLVNITSENASRSVTQRFDVSQHLEKVSWDWVVGRKVWLQYVDETGAESPEIIVSALNFEIEYRQRQIETTDNITCDVVGSIENRPDAVIQYLLTEKAGVPLSTLGSVFREIPKWNDANTWDDSEIWQDEGQVTDVPAGAAFEEAASWFDFHNYLINGVISGLDTVKDAVADLTWQTRSRILWQNGLTQLVILRKETGWIPAKSLNTSEIQLKSISVTRSNVNEIVNDIDLFHTIDRLSTADGGGQYTDSVSVRDTGSISRHGTRSNENQWLFHLIRDQATAESIADYYLWLLGETTAYYTFNTYLNNFDLEKEDYVQFETNGLSGVKGSIAVIKEMVREFGSGKNSKINTLQLVSQVIRHNVLVQALDSGVVVNDSLEGSLGSDIALADVVSVIGDLIFFAEIGIIDDSLTVSDVVTMIQQFRPDLTEQVNVVSELSTQIYFELYDSVITDDTLNVTDARCFGSCGFGGGVSCELPFGSSARDVERAENDFLTVGDTINTVTGIGESDTVLIGDDDLTMTSCFGAPIDGTQGFGESCFGK